MAHIPLETYQLVVSYLDVVDRVHLLLVNKAFFSATVPAAWYEVWGLHALIHLLPIEISSTIFEDPLSGSELDSESNSDIMFIGETGTKFVRPLLDNLSPDALSRIKIYAPHVKTLRVCQSKSRRYVYSGLSRLKQVTALTPFLEKLIIETWAPIIYEPFDNVLVMILDICNSGSLRSVSIVGPTDISPSERIPLGLTLWELEKRAPHLTDLTLSVDVRSSFRIPTTHFVILLNLTQISAPAALLRPILRIGGLPNLLKLSLLDWINLHDLRNLVELQESSNDIAWFPRLREISLTRILSHQVVTTLSQLLPTTLTAIELHLMDVNSDQDTLPILESISRSRDTLENLKITRPYKHKVITLKGTSLSQLCQLHRLNSLEMVRYQVALADKPTLFLSWPALVKLSWIDQTILVTELALIARERPLLREIGFALAGWDPSTFPPPGYPVCPPLHAPFSFSTRERKWDCLSLSPFHFESRFSIGNLDRPLVASLARYLVWCWRDITVHRIRPPDSVPENRTITRDQRNFVYLIEELSRVQRGQCGIMF